MPVRPLYDCTVLLNGSRDNSVFVPGITAVEMTVLRAIHGENESGTNPITNVNPTGKGVDRTDAQERARIAARYNAPGKQNGVTILNSLYGVGNRLPTEYEAPEVVDPGDLPLAREEERVVELKPAGPISSLPEPEPESAPEEEEAPPVKKSKQPAKSFLDE